MRTKKVKNGSPETVNVETNKPNVYDVIKEVGIPPLTRNGRASQYPFDALAVGDGFRFDSKKAKNVSMSARAFGKRVGCKFVVRRDPQHEGKHLCVRSE